ncbi:MAG: TIGR01777 family oxidoreductase [Anaplasmataceae bacterium]|nr:TIGR01777 family oxidoreductase [Anaplasmataceae bacterium]
MVKILVSGAHGLLGRHLIPELHKIGHEVVQLVREAGTPSQGVVRWDPLNGQIDPQTLEGFDVVIHLAGKNISTQRWTASVKKDLFQSRCRDTWLLAQGLSRVSSPPKVLLTASAVGFYGNQGEEWVDENSSAGEGFLADLCVHWERATEVIVQNGTRVVHTRFGSLFHPDGGMIARLKGPFRLGVGAILGTGQQWMSWISLHDAVRAIQHVLRTSTLRGGVNVCTEHPARNEEFTRAFAAALHRKAYLRIPAFFLKGVFGEIANELLLTSIRARPRKLLESGFQFDQPNLESLFQAFAWN